MLADNRGIVLSNVVDLDFLKKLEPQYFTEYIKQDIINEINLILFEMVKV